MPRKHRIASALMLAHQLVKVLETIEQKDMAEQRHELWNNAAVKAFNQLYEGIRFDRDDDGTFIFPSRSRSGLAHHVNGTCDCEAYADHSPPEPCWHRPAKAMVLGAEQDTFAVPVPPPAPDPKPYHCPHCASPMLPALTPGGQDCIECVNPTCQKTIMAEVVEAFFA
jgi:hypothetical protein